MAKYIKDYRVDCSGTSFRGHKIEASYNSLCEVLGESNCNGDGDKVTTEWIIRGPRGEAITVYDWKEGLSQQQVCDGRIIEWHVGAHSNENSRNFIFWLTEILENKSM